MPVLEADAIGVRFGGLEALVDVSLQVEEGQIVGIIGPNGSGKTTLFNCISGFVKPSAGSIRFQGTELRGLAPHARAKLGIARTFQQLGLAKAETVRENLLIYQHRLVRYPALAGLFLPVGREERRLAARADEVLALLDLQGVAATRVADLPYGVAKLVELAAAVACSPTLLLLDECASGLGPEETEDFAKKLLNLRRASSVTVLLIEHHVPLVAEVCDRVYALNFGRVVAYGRPEEVQRHPEVLLAYLGEEAEPDAANPDEDDMRAQTC